MPKLPGVIGSIWHTGAAESVVYTDYETELTAILVVEGTLTLSSSASRKPYITYILCMHATSIQTVFVDLFILWRIQVQDHVSNIPYVCLPDSPLQSAPRPSITAGILNQPLFPEFMFFLYLLVTIECLIEPVELVTDYCVRVTFRGRLLSFPMSFFIYI